MNDMAVGQDETIRRKHKTGTGSAPTPVVVHFDLDHGRTDPLGRRNYSLRIGIE